MFLFLSKRIEVRSFQGVGRRREHFLFGSTGHI